MSIQVRPAVHFQNLLARAVRDKIQGREYTEVKLIDTGRDSISRFKITVGSMGRGIEVTVTLRKQELEEPELYLKGRISLIMVALDSLGAASVARK